jgi:hypothetical protein
VHARFFLHQPRFFRKEEKQTIKREFEGNFTILSALSFYKQLIDCLVKFLAFSQEKL